jgi:predicted short-subunit dehydrogenase-like oxidoreductase (DUF2520 family)
MRIAIVGRGRLGRSLAELWPATGHEVALIPGRGAPHDVDLVVLAVPDGAVAEVAARIPPGPIVLHCAGALELDVLAPHAERGSLHPLMAFPGPGVGLPDLRGVPAAVAGTPRALAAAAQLARDLGMEPFEVPGDRRLYHAAAVLAGNFPLVLAAEGARVLREAGVPPEVADRALLPLAARAVQNAAHGLGALTGPLARGDEQTVEAHLAALGEAGLSDVVTLYAALAKHTLGRLRTRSEPGSGSA